jgi:hypothetical protein
MDLTISMPVLHFSTALLTIIGPVCTMARGVQSGVPCSPSEKKHSILRIQNLQDLLCVGLPQGLRFFSPEGDAYPEGYEEVWIENLFKVLEFPGLFSPKERAKLLPMVAPRGFEPLFRP